LAFATIIIKFEKKGMKRTLSLIAFSFLIIAGYNQTFYPLNAGDGRFNYFSYEQGKPSLDSRATGTYYLDYLEYDKTFLGNTIDNGVYGNLCFTKTDTSYGVIPFVAEYYDSLVLSTNLLTWNAVPWNNLLSMTIDSVFIKLNVDNMSGTMDKLKMKIVDPTITSSGAGDWRNFNVAPVWQDSIMTNLDVGTHGSGSITFATIGFDVGIAMNNKFGLMFEFSGDLQDTCRLIWSYPTDGAACSNGAISAPNKTPKQWDLYPTSYYNICTGGTGLVQNYSVGFPRINGSRGFAFYVDCSNPASPYINDSVSNGFDGNKNQFQHWNMWAVVTVTDNIGIEEQNEKGIRLFAYPNPAAEILNINFDLSNPASNVLFTISNLNGSNIYTKNMGSYPEGKNVMNVPIDLVAGMYAYTLTINEVSITRKFIVNN
jgi:hypothetical protein